MDDHPYEGHATRTTVHLAQRRTETERPILSFSRFPAAGPNYSPALAEAMQFRCMSREEFRDLIQDDLITLGRNRNHAVVEISLRPSNEDIRRAMHGDSIFQEGHRRGGQTSGHGPRFSSEFAQESIRSYPPNSHPTAPAAHLLAAVDTLWHSYRKWSIWHV